MIQVFLELRYLIHELNRATLILKKITTEKVNDDSPISLSNVYYKFDSNLLANSSPIQNYITFVQTRI